MPNDITHCLGISNKIIIKCKKWTDQVTNYEEKHESILNVIHKLRHFSYQR